MSIGLDILLLPIIEVVLMGLLAGLVGAVALVHRRIFFTESLTHATFPGAIVGVVPPPGSRGRSLASAPTSPSCPRWCWWELHSCACR